MRRWPVFARARLTDRCVAQSPRRLSSAAPQRKSRPVVLPSSRPDPFALAAPHLLEIRTALVSLLGSSVAGLDQISKYYFLRPSKLLRPLLVVLFSLATNGLGKHWQLKSWRSTQDGPGGHADALDQSLTRPDVLSDFNPDKPTKTASFSRDFSLDPSQLFPQPPNPPVFPDPPSPPVLADPIVVLPSQIRLAQIVEMIHAASLLHDDVIDNAALRRGVASAPVAFGNKFSVLAGNFILGRASAALARLGDQDVTELIASILTNLVEGEILQLKDILSSQLESASVDSLSISESPGKNSAWLLYLQKTYMKTASLMAKGARGAVALGGCEEGELYRDIAYAYGRNLGLAFQLIDDVLDYEAGEATLGKPGGADLQLGIATGPALYAWEEHPELGPLIQRKFEKEGDVELARELVRKSAGVERTRELAHTYAYEAINVLQSLPDSDAKAALKELAERVVRRKS